MFTQIFAAVESITARLHQARTRRSIALLRTQNRSVRQEIKARQVESRLFFDADLLAAARDDRKIMLRSLQRGLLACGFGAMLSLSPMTSQAADDSRMSESTVTAAAGGGESGGSVLDIIEAWIEETFELLDDPTTDPKEGGQ